MLQSAAQGFRERFPDMLNAAVQLVAKLFGSLIENRAKLLAAGVQLILSLVKGLIQATPSVLSAIGQVAVGIVKGIGKVNLFSAGKAIIDGFVKGLKSAWEAGKNFVKGIGGWIAKNKGPISYDRRLLKPAGNAIMGGLNESLINSFRSVQRTVGGMAGSIYDTFNTSPVMDINGSIARSNAQVNSAVRHELGSSRFGGGVNITQYITSPEALNEREMQRRARLEMERLGYGVI